MNKRYFISQFILLWLCCSVNISYACNLPPVAHISNCPKYKKMDYPVSFYGLGSTDPSEDGYIVEWRWYFPPEAYDISHDFPWEAECKFSSQGTTYTVRLEVEDNEGATGVFDCTVYVPKVNLDISGVAEEDETDPGGYIAVNTDDDNKNSNQDKEDDGTVDDEDDLVEITLSMEPSVSEGYIKLCEPSRERLKVWVDQTKGTELNVHDPFDPSYAIWDLSEGPFPTTLWVEGYGVDNAVPNSVLALSYSNGYTLDSDIVKFNLVKVPLSMNGVNEDNEEFPGNYILYNKDDDDNDGVPDYDDDENPAEDDLVRIRLNPAYPDLYLTGPMTFDVTSGASKVRVWSSETKGEGNEISLPENYNTPGDLPKTFYVEGIEESGGPRDVTIKLTYTKEGLTFEDKIKVTVVHVELFRDSAYTQLLDDWPKSGDLLRSPKYIFGEDDPIYVQVKNIGKDPDLAEPITAVVAVKSPSSGYIYLDLKETGLDTEVFRNSEADTGELLYLSTEDSDDYPDPTTRDTIRVINEEVLNIWLRIPPPIGCPYKRSVDVMVDRAEIGVEWQNKYDEYCGHDLSHLNSHRFSRGLYDNIGGSPGLEWFKNFKWFDLDSKADHWSADGDSAYADSVDIAAWTGHSTGGDNLHFFRSFWGCVNLPRADMSFGDKDADWLVFHTCYFLYGSLLDLMEDLLTDGSCPHLFCGFTYPGQPTYLNFEDCGWYFAQRLKQVSIKEAWFDYCQDRQRVGTVARVFGAYHCMNDSLTGPGPREVSRDPHPSSTLWVTEEHEKTD